MVILHDDCVIDHGRRAEIEFQYVALASGFFQRLAETSLDLRTQRSVELHIALGNQTVGVRG